MHPMVEEGPKFPLHIQILSNIAVRDSTPSQVIKFPHAVDRGVQQVSSRVCVEQKNQPSATNRDHAKQPLSQALQRDNEPAATGFPWPGASGIDCASGADPSFPPTRPQPSAPGDNRDSARSARLFTRC